MKSPASGSLRNLRFPKGFYPKTTFSFFFGLRMRDGTGRDARPCRGGGSRLSRKRKIECPNHRVFNFNFSGINDLVKLETAMILLDFPKQNNVHLKNKFFPNSVPCIIVVIFSTLIIFIKGIAHIENSPVIITCLISYLRIVLLIIFKR